MQRPGPLQEWPLERFMPPNPNIPPASVKPIRSNKRPFSPGGPTPFSPAKRRILNDEGIFSSEKTCKSPLPSLTARLASPAQFSRVLVGPASPARVLDFGLPKNVEGDPQKRSSLAFAMRDTSPGSPPNKLAPSPEFKAKGRNLRSTKHIPDEDSEDEVDSECFSLNSTTSPIFTLREMPPPPNPLSIHYPGFSVYQDTHIMVFPLGCPETPQPVEPGTHKENLPPRRKGGKSTSGADAANHDPFSSGAMTPRKSKQNKDTPQRTGLWNSDELTSTISRNKLRISSPTSESKKARRQAMKDEMDVAEEDSDLSDQ